MSIIKPNDLDAIQQRFHSVSWHDSRLLGVHIEANSPGATYTVRLSLKLIERRISSPSPVGYSSATLSFIDCRFVRIDSYLLGMSLCGGDIASAVALSRSDSLFLQEIEAFWNRVPVTSGERLDSLYHFRFEMIAPGGDLDFIAEDFKIVMEATGSR